MKKSDEDSELVFVKSRWSRTECVEVARRPDGQVALRNSRRRDDSPLTFTEAEWSAFLKGVRTGDFDGI